MYIGSLNYLWNHMNLIDAYNKIMTFLLFPFGEALLSLQCFQFLTLQGYQCP